jgi:hypothetical protein
MRSAKAGACAPSTAAKTRARKTTGLADLAKNELTIRHDQEKIKPYTRGAADAKHLCCQSLAAEHNTLVNGPEDIGQSRCDRTGAGRTGRGIGRINFIIEIFIGGALLHIIFKGHIGSEN